MKRHQDNERMKRNYLAFLKEAKGRDEASIDSVAQSLDEFDAYNKFRDFRRFHIEQARGYKGRLLAATNARTGRPLAAATIKARLSHLKAFFEWLAQEPGYRRSIKAADASYSIRPKSWRASRRPALTSRFQRWRKSRRFSAPCRP